MHDVVDQQVSLHWLQQQVHAQAKALRLTPHAFELALARHRSGLANNLQLLSSEGQVLAQKGHVVQAQSRQRELGLNLIRAGGGGYQPTDVPDDTAIAHAQAHRSKS